MCEHASNYIPAEYAGLGLSDVDLKRHIAWDIGAAEVTRQLSDLLGAPAYLATASRLLIDLNRPLQATDSIPTRSEDTEIPGNIGLASSEIERRRARLFVPFHARVAEVLSARQKAGRPTKLVTIHSFTPVYRGVARHWHGGVLFAEAADFGHAVIDALKAPGLMIGANVPYQTSRDSDYAVPVHGDDRGIPAVLIEIRQDLIADAAGAGLWAQRLAAALTPV